MKHAYPTSARDGPRDDLIPRQREEIARLREDVARAQQRREAERDRDRLKCQNEGLTQTTGRRAPRGVPT